MGKSEIAAWRKHFFQEGKPKEGEEIQEGCSGSTMSNATQRLRRTKSGKCIDFDNQEAIGQQGEVEGSRTE